MRRLLAAAAIAAAAVIPTTSAVAAVPCYGNEVRLGTLGNYGAGVCAGTECTDLCEIVVRPYCYGPQFMCAF